MRRLYLCFLFAASAGCYGGQFDGSAADVFACSTNEDCPSSQICLLDVCVTDDAPELTVLGPEPLQGFATDATSFSLTLANGNNESFVLGEPGDAAADGHVRVWVDGEEITPIVSGDLAASVRVDGISIPEPTIGAHRIRALVFDTAGKPLPNPSTVGDRLFFVNDPDASPMIALRKPFPRWDDVPLVVTDRLVAGEEFQIEVAAHNIEWHNPVDDVDQTPGQGHSHIFLLDDFPDCLPGCNYSYMASLKPAASSSEDDRIIDGPAAMLLPTEPGARTLSAGLQHNNHFPYGSTTDKEDDWDPNTELVYDQIPVEFFAE